MDVSVEALYKLVDSKLIFITAEGEFEGILRFLVLKKKRAVFEHAYYRPSRKYMGTMHVDFSNLLSYKLLENSSAILDVSKLCAMGELSSCDIEKQSRVDKYDSLGDASVFCYERLPADLKVSCPEDYCYIESICPSFFRAIDHISEVNTIGVSFHGSEISRNGSLSWVCITTPQCVFMFDIDNMGITAFNKGLRKIFEDKFTEKVIHDCREPSDALKHMFQTTLSNVFDTQLADYLVNMQRYTGEAIFKYVSSLDTCLVKYLDLPQQFLYNRNKCLSKEEENRFFKMRPINEEFKSVLIKSCLYLLSLKKKQEELLLYPYYQAVNIYLNVLKNATEADVFRISHEFTQVAPRYLLDSIKTVRFEHLPLPPDDTVSQLRQTAHGKEAWRKRMLLRRSKGLISNE